MTTIANLTESAERSLKGFVRFLSAINQTPLKTVLDPVYELGAKLALRNVAPPRDILERTFDENTFFKYRELSAKLAYDIGDLDFAEAQPALLTHRERALVHSFACGETSGFAVGASFLDSFRNLPELASFFGIWFSEELNHYWGYHRYLERMGEAWRHEEKESVTGIDFRAYAEDAREVAAANMYQELVAYLVYSSFARQVLDPFLADMAATFAKDELRHYKFYQYVVEREIKKDPSFREVALKHFFKATTPMNQVSGSASKTVDHLTHAAFYFRKREFDFLLKQNEILFGDRLEHLFDFFYRRHIPGCEACQTEVYLCACADFEPAEHARIRREHAAVLAAPPPRKTSLRTPPHAPASA